MIQVFLGLIVMSLGVLIILISRLVDNQSKEKIYIVEFTSVLPDTNKLITSVPFKLTKNDKNAVTYFNKIQNKLLELEKEYGSTSITNVMELSLNP